MAREKKEKPRKEKRAKKEKEQNEETLLQKLMRQAKIKGTELDEAEPSESPESSEEQEEAGGGKRKLILLIGAVVLVLIAVAVVVIFVILPKLSGDKEPDESTEPTPSHEPVLYDLPENFQVGGETVVGVVPVNPDGVQAELFPWVSYTYTGMTDAGAETAAYAANLRSAGFSVVDEGFVRTEAPDYTAPEGTVLLAKNIVKTAPEADPAGGDADASDSPAPSDSAEPSDSAAPSPSPTPVPEEEQKDMVLRVKLDWSEGTMAVTCDQAEGKVTGPAGENGPATPGASMSMTEAVDYLYTLHPADLGLEGDSMESYYIYAMDGAVLVDRQPCMRLNIYSRDGDGQSNVLAGIYLLSRDGEHLYLLDEQAQSVREVKLPG